MLDMSGKTYNIGGLSKGVMVFANDTTFVCDKLKDLNVFIQIIENYCMLYDITINAKITKSMIFGTVLHSFDLEDFTLIFVISQIKKQA